MIIFPWQQKTCVNKCKQHPLLHRICSHESSDEHLRNPGELDVLLSLYKKKSKRFFIKKCAFSFYFLIFLIFQKLNDKVNVIFSRGKNCTMTEAEEMKHQFTETHRRIEYYSQRLEIYRMRVETLHAEFFQQFVCFGHSGQKILRNGNFATITPFTLLT